MRFAYLCSKSRFKNAIGFNTAEFATEVDLASLQSNVDKLDIDKSKNIPNNLSNLKSKVAKLVSVPVNLSKTK